MRQARIHTEPAASCDALIDEEVTQVQQRALPGAGVIQRHSLLIRVTHWVNLLCATILLMSGLQIFNAHPALYWGAQSNWNRPVLALWATRSRTGQPIGLTTVLGHSFNTTGVLGLSPGPGGIPVVRGFPAWATLPGPQWLAMGRRWHFLFAWIFVLNGLVYVAYSLASRHFWQDLLPTSHQLRYIGRAAWDHIRFRLPRGEHARSYNVLQRLAYVMVAFGAGPLMVATGLTMSPRIDAAYPLLLDLFGGRQSARTIHFITAFALVAFVVIHVLMVVISGPWNTMRSMITGRYVIREKGGADEPEPRD